MSFNTILVSLNDVSRRDTLLSASIGLAAKHSAHLIGLYVIPAARIYPGLVPAGGPTVIDTVRVFFEDRATATKKAFNEAVLKAGIEAEWREIDSPGVNVADGVIEHSFQADVVIASQQNEDANDGLESNFCERIVMESGRPVLLIPKIGKFDHIGKSIIVGWNATRESARATFDAMPLLEKSETARLIWVDPQNADGKAGNLPGSEMAATLARHGINSTAEAMPTNGVSSGDALINRACDLGADLIVAGAYGHSRMREFVFGGVTRTLLDHMTVPVLMSH